MRTEPCPATVSSGSLTAFLSSDVLRTFDKIKTAKQEGNEHVQLDAKVATILRDLKVLVCPKRITTFVTHIKGLARSEDSSAEHTLMENIIVRDKVLQVFKQTQILFRKILSRGHKALEEMSRLQLNDATDQLRDYLDYSRKVEWKISKQSYSEFQDKALQRGAKIAHVITKVAPEFSKPTKRLSLQEELVQEEMKWHKL